MNEAQKINVQLIDRPNPPVRIAFDEGELESLAASIGERGILVPLLVRRVGNRYEVIDGDRRLAAAYRLRISEVPCVVRDADDRETHVLRLLANMDRSDPDPVSEALYVSKALASGSITREDLAQKLNRGENWIDDRLAIASMPDYMQEALREKRVQLGVALALAQVDEEHTRERWFNGAIIGGMTVRAAQEALRQYRNLKELQASSPASADAPPIPVEIPRILYPCARCGREEDAAVLRFVRVHPNPADCEAYIDTSSEVPSPNRA